MPDNLYFREPGTQTLLLDILFIFCKLNQDVGYRQGMHELLAPVLWVISRDALEKPTSDESNLDANSDGLMDITLDSRFIEHDAFTIFSIMMRSAKSFYELGGQVSEAKAVHSLGKTVPQNRSAIVSRSERIHEDLLARVDPEFANWLKEIEVLPQVFLM
jgi:TBC1 domain family protein 5